MPRLKQPKPSSHVADAQALIDAVIVVRGDGSRAQDAAEANALLALAAVVDANPANIGALRELRITLDGFRKDAVRHDPREDLEFAQLVATLSGPPPDTWDAVYNAVITAGGSDDAAFAAASAACGNPDAIKWPGMIDGVPQGPLPTDAQLERLEARRQTVLSRRR
jgi:hypothetical protein